MGNGSKRDLVVAILVAILALTGAPDGAIAVGPEAELFKQALMASQSAETAGSPEERLRLLSESDALLERIITDFPQSALAKRLVAGDPIGKFSRSELQRNLTEAKARPSGAQKSAPPSDLEAELAGSDDLAVIHATLAQKDNDKKAVALADLLIARKSPYGKALKAQLLLRGKGLPKDTNAARVLFEEAAQQGVPYAMYYMGSFHGSDGDYELSFKERMRAAELGSLLARRSVIKSYLSGNGTFIDCRRAEEETDLLVRSLDSGKTTDFFPLTPFNKGHSLWATGILWSDAKWECPVKALHYTMTLMEDATRFEIPYAAEFLAVAYATGAKQMGFLRESEGLFDIDTTLSKTWSDKQKSFCKDHPGSGCGK